MPRLSFCKHNTYHFVSLVSATIRRGQSGGAFLQVIRPVLPSEVAAIDFVLLPNVVRRNVARSTIQYSFEGIFVKYVQPTLLQLFVY